MAVLQESALCFPELLNASCRKPKRQYSETMLIYLLLSFITLITVILNLLVIISISHFKKLHTPTNLLLLSLAASDLFVGIMMPFQILITDGCWVLGDIMCAVLCVLDFISTSASVGSMVLISIDRYVAICDPLHYITKVSVRRVTTCICICWICSVLYNCVLLSDNLKQLDKHISCSGECVITFKYIAGAADVILTFIGPVTVIMGLYMRVFFVAVSQARAMRSYVTTVSLSASVCAKKSELKAARNIGVIIIVFLTCLCPYFCSSLLVENSLFNVTSLPFQRWLFYFNSCLNPVIYTFCYPWYRKSIKLIITFKILEPDSCEANVL